MNKKDIAECIFKTVEIKRFEAYCFIDLLIEEITNRLREGEKVVISNFGTLKVVDRLKKRVINPNDKKEMIIPGRKVVKFLPSAHLKDIVRGNLND
jgi:nucleoid DNA-binding protein